MLKIYEFDVNFKEIFNLEKEKLKKILPSNCIIEHIGSTAIDGVKGKGIIDIMVALKDISDIKIAIEVLLKNNYYLAADNKNRNGRFFMSSSRKESRKGDIHIHITDTANENYINSILFRDYLIKNKNLKNEYIQLKIDIAKKVQGNREKYTELKNDFIKKIIRLAKITD